MPDLVSRTGVVLAKLSTAVALPPPGESGFGDTRRTTYRCPILTSPPAEAAIRTSIEWTEDWGHANPSRLLDGQKRFKVRVHVSVFLKVAGGERGG